MGPPVELKVSNVVLLVQGTSRHHAASQEKFLVAKEINFHSAKHVSAYRHRSCVLQISVNNLKGSDIVIDINTICISNLIVFGEAKRLEDSLVGEGVAWLLVDTEVLRRTDKHRH